MEEIMVKVSNLGYPRLGEQREWKQAIEAFWAGNLEQKDLEKQLKQLRINHLKKQKEAGIDLIPVGDFSCYDHVLDLSFQFNVIPKRFDEYERNLDLYFAIARGDKDNVASSMKKWFNTNYHYIVPEWEVETKPHLQNNYLLDLYLEAREVVGDKAKPVITGPITYVSLSSGIVDFEATVQRLLPLYKQVFQDLIDAGATYIQIDEPIFVTDEGELLVDIAKSVYDFFAREVPQAHFIFQTYFESAVCLDKLSKLPVTGFGLDFIHGRAENVAAVKQGLFREKELFAGIVNGRNIWAVNLEETLALLEEIGPFVKRLTLQPSSSLLHVPVTTKYETHLDPVLKNGLSFADEKLKELELLASAFDGNKTKGYHEALSRFSALQAADFRHVALESLAEVRLERSPYKLRQALQAEKLQLPILPTTTIGSFPQSPEIRKKRLAWKRENLSDSDYKDFIKTEIRRWIAIIQVDEAALREGLPLRQQKQQAYLDDAVAAFKIATSSVKDETQIHTHMCYSKFDEIIDSIRSLDADVISIETSRSHGDIIESFETAVYPLGIGLGVYDIHSPRIPTKEEIIVNIQRSLKCLSKEQFWVNPDCGLKTRREAETIAALEVLVSATKEVRQQLDN